MVKARNFFINYAVSISNEGPSHWPREPAPGPVNSGRVGPFELGNAIRQSFLLKVERAQYRRVASQPRVDRTCPIVERRQQLGLDLLAFVTNVFAKGGVKRIAPLIDVFTKRRIENFEYPIHMVARSLIAGNQAPFQCLFPGNRTRFQCLLPGDRTRFDSIFSGNRTRFQLL